MRYIHILKEKGSFHQTVRIAKEPNKSNNLALHSQMADYKDFPATYRVSDNVTVCGFTLSKTPSIESAGGN